ncbi:MAG: recombinase family protein [Alphaproteobacteria bacterium]|nr:recombinase family protein [Alphaproteobacteria bacterium]
MQKQAPGTATGTKIGYARVSTKDQKLDGQFEQLRAADVEEDNLFGEKVSGVAKRRPRLEEALAKADRGDTIVVCKFDRFGRSMVEILQRLRDLDERGVGFVSLGDQFDTTTPAGRFMMHTLAAVAEFERDMIRERTRVGMQRKIASGYRPGPTPKLDLFDGKPRRLAKDMRADGAKVREISAEIEKQFGLKVSLKTIYNQVKR